MVRNVCLIHKYKSNIYLREFIARAIISGLCVASFDEDYKYDTRMSKLGSYVYFNSPISTYTYNALSKEKLNEEQIY